MKCLVLGGGGFIGSHLCERLLEEGYSVRVFDKEGTAKENLESFIEDIELFEGNYLCDNDLERALKGADVIFHAISTTVPKLSNENPIGDISSNVLPTLTLLEKARTENIQKIIFFSSGGTVYGNPKLVPITEEHPTDPICSYGIHKLAIEKYLAMYHKLYGLDYAILRVSNPYGERQNPLGSQGVISVFAYKALRDQPIEIWGDGSVVRDYIYIKDVTEAAVRVLTCSGGEKLFNIGSGEGLSLNDVVAGIEHTLGRKIDVRYTENRAFDVPANILNINRAREYFGWTPETNFLTGLEKTVNFLKQRC